MSLDAYLFKNGLLELNPEDKEKADYLKAKTKLEPEIIIKMIKEDRVIKKGKKFIVKL